jgi:hypothetical protein
LQSSGPLRDKTVAFTGSLLIIKAESEADARALLEFHPYDHAGIWNDIDVRAFGAVGGDWVGGRLGVPGARPQRALHPNEGR